MIKDVHKWEQAVITLLNLDGWNLEHTGEGFEHYDAIGTSPKGTNVVIEMKFRNKYYKEKLLEVYKYDKLIETGKIVNAFESLPSWKCSSDAVILNVYKLWLL